MNFETFELIDRYLVNELNEQELESFNLRMKTDSLFASEVNTRKELIELLAMHDERSTLKAKLNRFHSEMDGLPITASTRLFTLLKKQIHNKIVVSSAVAACISAIVVLSTLYLSGWFAYQNQITSYMELKNNLANIKSKQQSLWNAMFSHAKDKSATPSGTCFSVSSNGYLVTNYHVVKNVDSIFIINYKDTIIRYKATLAFKDESHDLAIIKIDDTKFKTFGKIPYIIKQGRSELGENVFTLGYSKKDLVYGEGYLSSFTGFDEDSAAYQASIPVNPGNSGSPLLNSKGELIGIVSGKHSQNEGATFAIKSVFLLNVLDSINNDKQLLKPILSRKNDLFWAKRTEQVKKLHPFIFKVEVYR